MIEEKPLGWFKPDARNPRRHGPEQVRLLVESLVRYGQRKAVCALPDGTLVAGHGTVEAAKLLGLPSLVVDIWDAAPSEAVEFMLMDNALALLSEWDMDLLPELLADLPEESRVFVGEGLGVTRGEYDEKLEEEQPGGDERGGRPAGKDDPGPSDPDSQRAKGIPLTNGQREVWERAMDRVKEHVGEGADEMSEGRLLELLCADWLAG